MDAYTHAMQAWIDNDYEMYHTAIATARDLGPAGAGEIAEELALLVSRAAPELPSPYCELLQFAMEEVDYHELAEIYLDEALG